ncbi:MAG: AraC family transcriptional regulator [Clostridiales bacterium]|nr:AraC family transcriptional regulator [Clostridiales bacterium]
MFYDAELRFLQSALEKYRLQTLLLDPTAPPDHRMDLGLRKQLGASIDYSTTLYRSLALCVENTIYKLTDQFLCSYLFLRLPETQPSSILLIGPYFETEWSRERLMEQSEKNGIQPQQFHHMERYYSSVPAFPTEAFLLSLVHTFAEVTWGSSDNFTLLNVNQERPGILAAITHPVPGIFPEDTEHAMLEMEKRYAVENELMQIVSQGLSHKAEVAMAAFSPTAFERRAVEPIRDLKNYCIIMNTLLRKAAENGGVHPIYLDKVSSSFAHKIEQISSTEGLHSLMGEMLRSYCRLVRKNSTRSYSSPVQKAIVRIEANLNMELSLKILADSQNISASYLSGLFKKETGQTITEYINEKRIKLAQHLLRTSHLQIQTVAQHCGIPDVNYFSKVFKKYVGKTPKEYRKETALQK